MEYILPLHLLLDIDSPRHALSKLNNVVLRPHQSAALARCIEIESGDFRYDCIPLSVLDNMKIYDMKSRVAVICDKPGAGKSYVVISLCVATRYECVPHAVHNISHANGLLSYVTEDTASKCIQTNLIVVPHGLVSQWTHYLKESGIYDDCIIYNRRNEYTTACLTEALLSDNPPLIVVCSSSCYPTLSAILTLSAVRVRRLFIDEADSIVIGATDLVGAAMYWFVTASLDCMMCPVHTASKTWEKGIRSRCIFTLLNYFRYSAPYIRTLIFVKSKESFVDDSLRLDDFLKNYVLCTAPAGTGILRGIADSKIMHALRTDDIKLALSYVKQKGDNDNIVASLTQCWKNSSDILKSRLIRLELEDTNLWSQQDFDYKKNMERQVASYKSWLSTIQSRVDEDNLCPICFDKHEHKTLMTCCTATFCFKCATRWITSNHTCPNCRHAADTSTMHVIVDESKLIKDKSAIRAMSKSETAIALIDRILESSETARILLCCSNTTIFDRIESLSLHGVAVLKGTGASIRNSVEKFQKGDRKIMCVSSGSYCSGINLPFVSDIIVFDRMEISTEDQVIGRAQRPGRDSPLNVWFLVQESERGAELAKALETF